MLRNLFLEKEEEKIARILNTRYSNHNFYFNQKMKNVAEKALVQEMQGCF